MKVARSVQNTQTLRLGRRRYSRRGRNSFFSLTSVITFSSRPCVIPRAVCLGGDIFVWAFGNGLIHSLGLRSPGPRSVKEANAVCHHFGHLPFLPILSFVGSDLETPLDGHKSTFGHILAHLFG